LLCGTSAPVAPDSALARGTGVAIGDVVLKRFVYVLRNAETPARYYTGLSSDVVKRLASHNAGDNRHTAKYRPWSIYVVIEFPDDRRAVAFERYLKSGSGVAFAQRPPGTRIAGCEG
jgi:predicted GIY-YIG superfamily endonuclease